MVNTNDEIRSKLIETSITVGKRITNALNDMTPAQRKRPGEGVHPRTKKKCGIIDFVTDGILVEEFSWLSTELGVGITLLAQADVSEEVKIAPSGSSKDRIVAAFDVIDGTTNIVTYGTNWATSLGGFTDPTSKGLEQLTFGDFVTGVIFEHFEGNSYFAHPGIRSKLRDSRGREFPLTTTPKYEPKEVSLIIDSMAARATFPPGPERETKGNERRAKFESAVYSLRTGGFNDIGRLFGAGKEQLAMLAPDAGSSPAVEDFHSGNSRYGAFIAGWQFKENIAGPAIVLERAGASVTNFRGEPLNELPFQQYTHYLAAGNAKLRDKILEAAPLLRDFDPTYS